MNEIDELIKKYGATPIYKDNQSQLTSNGEIQTLISKYGATPIYEDKGILSQIGTEAKGVALNFIKDFVKGGGSLVDLATEIAQGGAPDDAMSFAPHGSINPTTGKKDIFARREELGEFIQQHNAHKPKFNFGIEENVGRGLNNLVGEEIKPESALQNIASSGGRLASGALLGGPAGFLRNAGIGAGMGALSGGLQEGFNLPQTAADLTSLATFLTASGAPKLASIFKNSASISDAEKRVANYLQQNLGEEGTKTVSENISKAPKYPTTGYEPTTAEVANHPLMSQLHRSRQGIPSSGLAEHAGSQNSAITELADKLSSDKITSDSVKDVITSELAKRKATRTSQTKPLYESLRKEQTQINPTNIEYFLEENSIVKGKKKKDLENIEKLIKPSKKLTQKEEGISRRYKEQESAILGSKMSESAKNKALTQLEKPKENYPTVADLDEARQNINDKIKLLKKSGQDNRVQQLIKARDALDKDLAVFPQQAEVTAKYAELSKPVNEILEHPTLKKIPKNRLNNIFSELFSNKSYDNFTSLKQVLKDSPEEWKGIQDASVDYLMKSIRNAGAEGSGRVLSYPKLNKFLEKHEKALGEVFTEDQVKFLDELKNALHGRNLSETLGLEKGSQTYSKLITGTHLNEGLGTKVTKGLTYVPHATSIPGGKISGEFLRTMLNRYMKIREADVMSVVDRVLKEPEYAHKLLTHKFKNQIEFNKEMRLIVNNTVRKYKSDSRKEESSED